MHIMIIPTGEHCQVTYIWILYIFVLYCFVICISKVKKKNQDYYHNYGQILINFTNYDVAVLFFLLKKIKINHVNKSIFF